MKLTFELGVGEGEGQCTLLCNKFLVFALPPRGGGGGRVAEEVMPFF